MLYIRFQKCSQAFITKWFINLALLKLLMRFLHYVITMPVFQAEALACIIIQFRKFVYQAKLKILHKPHEHRKCNFVQSLDNETAKRP